MYVASIIIVFLLALGTFGNVGKVCALKCYKCSESSGPKDKQCGSNTPTETCKLRKNTAPGSGIYRDEGEAAEANQTTPAIPEIPEVTESEAENIEPSTAETMWDFRTTDSDYSETPEIPDIMEYSDPVCGRSTDGQWTSAGCWERSLCESLKQLQEVMKKVPEGPDNKPTTVTCCETDLCNRAVNGKPIEYTVIITCPLLALLINGLYF